MLYEPRLADVGWSHGTLVDPPVGPAPGGPVEERREVLASAEEIVNAVAPDLFEERRRDLERREKASRRTWKFWRR
jgi:hypothetical protein